MKALAHWPSEGIPPSPEGWIITTAIRRALDRKRRESTRDQRHRESQELYGPDEPHVPDEGAVLDDQLRLMFTCCHPSLARRAGGPHAAPHRGASDAGNRASVSGTRGHDGAAPGAREEQDSRRQDPLVTPQLRGALAVSARPNRAARPSRREATRAARSRRSTGRAISRSRHRGVSRRARAPRASCRPLPVAGVAQSQERAGRNDLTQCGVLRNPSMREAAPAVQRLRPRDPGPTRSRSSAASLTTARFMQAPCP